MPHISWDERSLGWFSDFSRYTGFHEKLAELLCHKLSGCGTLCDLGCGAGLVDLYLAGSVRQITCVDQSEAAIAFLRRESAARRISNLTALVADCADLIGTWDAVLFSFFGTGLLERFLPRCRHLTCVLGNDNAHGLLPGKQPRRHSAAQLEALLTRRKIPYSVQTGKLEAGQPFADMEEALQFMQCYSGCTEQEAADFLTPRLIPIKADGFRFYLPRAKPIAIVTIAGELS